MKRLIIICECPNAEQFCQDAHRLLFPKEDFPLLVKGINTIRSFANTTFEGETAKKIKALSKDEETFGYELVMDDDHNILEIWDIFAGKRIE